MYAEIVKLEITDEIDGFERTTLNRLLPSFETINVEAIEKRQKYLKRRSEIFDPDRDDEACIAEDGFFEELNHVHIENELKQELLNSTSTWLFHLLERQKIRVFGTHKSDDLKPKLLQQNYDISSCDNWVILNKELRLVANSIKHGNESNAMKDLLKKYPNLVKDNRVVISKADLERYILALRLFWSKALDGQVAL